MGILYKLGAGIQESFWGIASDRRYIKRFGGSEGCDITPPR
jgi:hypothetical protein